MAQQTKFQGGDLVTLEFDERNTVYMVLRYIGLDKLRLQPLDSYVRRTVHVRYCIKAEPEDLI